MAVRRCIVLLGDKVALGDVPQSDLTAINAAYDDPQPEAIIWNGNAGAWQPMEGGVNTNPGTDRWAYEVRLREELRSQIPTGPVYFIKHAVDSTLAHTSAKTSWSPSVTGSAFAAAIAKITAAAAAAGGDSLSIEWIIVGKMTDDYLTPPTATTYGQNLRALAEALRTSIAAIPNCTMGKINPSAVFTPVTILEPHFLWAGLSSDAQFRMLLYRAQVHRLTHLDIYSISVCRTHGLTAAADNLSLNAASMLEISKRLPASVLPAQPVDVSTSEAPLVCIFGDSILEGTGLNSALPPHLTTAQPGINIFQFKTGTFGTLEVGVNNLFSLPQEPYVPAHGGEIYLGELLRSLWGQVWLVKGTSVGVTSELWHPAFGDYFFDACVQGLLVSAIQTLRAQGKKPVAKMVEISLGTNDIIASSILTSEVNLNLRTLILKIKDVFQAQGVDISGLKFVLLLPRSNIQASPTRITEVRDSLLRIPEDFSDVTVVDLDPHESFDRIHLTAAGEDSCSQAVFDAFRGFSNLVAVEPLFHTSLIELRKALRLSASPNDSDSFAQITAAIQYVRTNFVQDLGTARVDAIRSMPFSINPRTAEEHTRMLAAQIEVKWVRSQLLRTMPTLFMDGSSKIQSWQTDAAFRETSFLQNERELKRLEEEILEGLTRLRTSTSASGRVTIDVLGNDNPATPGGSVISAETI